MTINPFRIILLVSITACYALFASVACAQELTPRAYWPTPKGTKALFVGTSYSSGDILPDPSLPVYGVDSKILGVIVGYLETLNVFGRTGNLILELPYASGTSTGSFDGMPVRRDFNGIGDVGVTLSVNLLGAPSLTMMDFQELRQNPRPILGTSFKLLFPTGQYDETKLFNVGANRMAGKLEFGYIQPLSSKWLLEFELGAWLFRKNDQFLFGEREQDPIFSFDTHLIRRFSPGFWASVDLNYYWGGRSSINGVDSDDIQRNSRLGLTIVKPFANRYALKLGLSTGTVTRSGGDFNMVLVSLQALIP